MDTVIFKCPNCDGGLVFDAKSQKFKCEYCLSEFTEQDLEALAKGGGEQEEPVSASAEPEREEEPAETAKEEMLLYTCPTCGAELVTGETTAASVCYYCHNNVVFSGKLEGKYRPDCVIPFERERKNAEEIFKSWISRKRYIPRDFYSPKQMEKMEGIYFPYWLYSCTVEGKIRADAVRRNVRRNGLEEITERSRYRVERQGKMQVKNVARNALGKADRRLAEGVMPFDMEKSRPFTAGYLSGFQAERRDREKDEFEKDVEQEVREYALNELKNSVSGFDTVTVEEHEERMTSPDWKYALFPVWVLTYRDPGKDKTYYFAMNGQSGKVCGVLPVDYKRLAGLFAAIFLPVFALMLIGGYLI